MIVIERVGGNVWARGRTKQEEMLLPWWPCTGATVRLLADDDLPPDWLEELVRYADEQSILREQSFES
jgi:hypothetical protein